MGGSKLLRGRDEWFRSDHSNVRESKMSWIKPLAVGALAAAAALATPASAVVTFASSSIITTPNIRYVSNGANPGQIYSTLGSATTNTDALQVFSVTDAVSGFLALAATVSNFNLLADVPVTSGLVAGNPFSITGVNGAFSYIATSPVTVGDVTGTNMLTAIFTNATLSGTVGGSQINLGGNNTTGTLVFSSDFLDFSAVLDLAFAFTGNTTAPLGVTSTRLDGFRASVNGSFSSDPAPQLGIIPEPETWAMLVLGFGLIGVSVRRRRNSVIA